MIFEDLHFISHKLMVLGVENLFLDFNIMFSNVGIMNSFNIRAENGVEDPEA